MRRLVLLWGLLALSAASSAAEERRIVDRDDLGRVVRVREFREGAAIWDVTYVPETGLPSEEVLLRDGVLAEISTLEFAGRDLVRRTVRDPSGAVLFTDTLDRWPDGTLRRLERVGPDGPLADAAWSYGPGGRLAAAWTSGTDGPGSHREWFFSGTITKESFFADTGLLMERVTEWLSEGRSVETRDDRTSGTKVVRQNDADGRPLEETVTAENRVTTVRRWVYDPAGRVLSLVTEAGGVTEAWGYTYRDDGTAFGRFSRSGIVLREETRRDGDLLEARYYDRGDLFLVETWAGGKKTKEQYYQKGAVVRERIP